MTKAISRPYINKNKKYRVLLAESNTGVRAMIKLYWDSLNMDYTTVETGEEALRHLLNTINSKEKKL